MKHETTPPPIAYIRSLFAPEDDLLQDVHARLKEQDHTIHIGAEEGKLLQLFIRMNNVKTVVEVGTQAGYSAVWMARALPEDGMLYTIEHDARRAEMAQETFERCEVGHKITLLQGKAAEVLPTLNGKAPFDMAFIDADKPGYCRYLNWAEQHICKGGLIIGDNTMLFGAVYQENVPEGISASTLDIMQEFNRRLANPEKYYSVMVPTEEGLTVGIKKF